MYCLCDGDSDIASTEEVLRCQKHEVMQPLPGCQSCLELDIKIVGGDINRYQLCQAKGKQKNKEEGPHLKGHCIRQEEDAH